MSRERIEQRHVRRPSRCAPSSVCRQAERRRAAARPRGRGRRSRSRPPRLRARAAAGGSALGGGCRRRSASCCRRALRTIGREVDPLAACGTRPTSALKLKPIGAPCGRSGPDAARELPGVGARRRAAVTYRAQRVSSAGRLAGRDARAPSFASLPLHRPRRACRPLPRHARRPAVRLPEDREQHVLGLDLLARRARAREPVRACLQRVEGRWARVRHAASVPGARRAAHVESRPRKRRTRRRTREARGRRPRSRRGRDEREQQMLRARRNAWPSFSASLAGAPVYRCCARAPLRAPRGPPGRTTASASACSTSAEDEAGRTPTMSTAGRDRGRRCALASHDARHRRAGAVLRAARRRSPSCRSCSRGRATQGHGVETIGLGSNLLVHDDGVDALVLRLAGELARGARRGDDARRGRRRDERRLPHRARDAGLGGFEFASAIPGTAGGGVRMNAGAYGSDWRAVLVDAVVVDARRRADASRPDELDLSYRHSGLAAGQVVAQVRFQLEPRPVEEIKATVAELLAQRKATQPTTKRTFGSVFKNPPGERGAGALIEACGLKGHRIGGALISRAPRELHRERGRRNVRRRDRADGRGAPARARASSASSSSTRCGSSARSSSPPL